MCFGVLVEFIIIPQMRSCQHLIPHFIKFVCLHKIIIPHLSIFHRRNVFCLLTKLNNY